MQLDALYSDIRFPVLSTSQKLVVIRQKADRSIITFLRILPTQEQSLGLDMVGVGALSPGEAYVQNADRVKNMYLITFYWPLFVSCSVYNKL
jgi:hypothetical protein